MNNLVAVPMCLGNGRSWPTTEIARLKAEDARLRGRDVDPQMELELLREQLAALQKEHYGPSSEKRRRPDSGTGDRDTSKRRGHGPRSQPDLLLLRWQARGVGGPD